MFHICIALNTKVVNSFTVCSTNSKKVTDRLDGESDLQEEGSLRHDHKIRRRPINRIKFHSWDGFDFDDHIFSRT